MTTLRFDNDYESYFDPKIYLGQYYEKIKGDENEYGSAVPVIKAFHEFWSIFEAPKCGTDVQYLEFGGGPSIANLIFACPKVDHIVFADYTKANREAVKSWIAGDADAYDWMPLIEVAVLELEKGLGIVEGDVKRTDEEKLDCVKRADELRRKIKSVVSCDVTKTPIVQLNTDDVAKPFDVVSSVFCLYTCASSERHYKNIVAELCKLLKPNGYLFILGFIGQTFYPVGEEKFSTFPLTETMVQEAMNEAEMEIVKFVSIPLLYSTEREDGKAIYYIYSKKSGKRQ